MVFAKFSGFAVFAVLAFSWNSPLKRGSFWRFFNPRCFYIPGGVFTRIGGFYIPGGVLPGLVVFFTSPVVFSDPVMVYLKTWLFLTVKEAGFHGFWQNWEFPENHGIPGKIMEVPEKQWKSWNLPLFHQKTVKNGKNGDFLWDWIRVRNSRKHLKLQLCLFGHNSGFSGAVMAESSLFYGQTREFPIMKNQWFSKSRDLWNPLYG